jgi:3',5'-cyclic AMP phosphodiesterase CpdA
MLHASKIVIATDLHLDRASPKTVANFLGSLGGVQADIMLLAGDLSNRANYSEHLALLAREFGRPVILVRGNHDFFGGSMRSADACHTRAIDEAGDVTHLNGDQVVEVADEVGIIGHD